MAPIPNVLEFLRMRIIRFAKEVIKRFPGRGAALLAFLGRKLIEWWRLGKRHLKPAERPSLGTKASSYPVSGGSAVVREYVIAASDVPASASYPSLHERREEQPEMVAQTVSDLPPDLANISVDHSHAHNTTQPLGGRTNRSSGSLSVFSVQSRASDRFSIIMNSRDLMRAPHGQPSRLPRGTHRQFGRGPDPSTTSTVDLPDELGSSTFSSPPTVEYFIPDGRFVQLINSDQIPRYEKNVTIPRVETDYDVKPLTTYFPYYPEQHASDQDSQGFRDQDCTPWKPATHPDGALYFYDEQRRLFTDTDMHSKTMRDEIEDFYHYLQLLIHNDQLSIPSKNHDLVMEIMVTDDERISWSYYYACHDARCLFWLEIYDASYTIYEVFGVKSPAHVKHRLEALYWNHWSLFPVVFEDRRLPFEVYDELMGTLVHGCVDVITSRFSTLPYDENTMRRMIRLVQAAKEAKGGLATYTAGITRLLSFFAHWRFLYCHGQRHARLIKEQSVYDRSKRERSLLVTLLSPLLFLAPEEHLREMEKWLVDDVIIESLWKQVWKSFMAEMVAEWTDVILWSTVMLTANVGFLAIPGVVLSNLSGTDITSAKEVVIFTSASQIASSLSVEASIGSIVIGLLLVRYNRRRGKEEDSAGVAGFLHRNNRKDFSLDLMAIIFCLPWALLMWSMVIFFVALLLFCFSISNASTRTSVAIMSVFLVALLVWWIWAGGLTKDEDVWPKSLAALRRTRGALFERVEGLNPFHTNRAQHHDHISLDSRLGDA